MTYLKTDMGTDISAHDMVCALVADILPLVQGSGNWSRLRQHLPLSAPRKGTKPIDSNLNNSMFMTQNQRVPAKLNIRNVSDKVFRFCCLYIFLSGLIVLATPLLAGMSPIYDF
jgi:hypothetical protein